MKSAALGTHISKAEVTNISKHGFWLLIEDEELFVSFKEFPWFKDAAVSEILNVEWPQPHHLYWPDLDVDIAVESTVIAVPTAPRSARRHSPSESRWG